MTLPDWSTAIIGQLNAFLGWSTVSGIVAILVGVGVGSIVLGMFLRVFHR